MARVLVVPDLGQALDEARLERWNFDEGDVLDADAVVADIETDKANLAVTVDAQCTLLKHLVVEGAVLKVSMPVAIVGNPGEPIDHLLQQAYAVLPITVIPALGTSARKQRTASVRSNSPRVFACPACAAPLPVEATGRWVCGYCGTTLVI